MHLMLRLGALMPRTSPGPPVHPGDFADPFVLRAGSEYFAYATQVKSTNVQVMSSGDLETWVHLGDALPELPAWAAPGFTWSPAVLARGERFVLYYTVREPESGRQAISVATSDRPAGPFVDTGSGPLIFQLDRGGSIDPSPFVDADGTAYLLWKSDDNALDRPSSLWAQPLASDGLTLVDRPVELLWHDQRWERPLIEGPSMAQAGDRYYLFYSANWWESDRYSMGWAVGPSPTGPFDKITCRRSWCRSNAAAAGSGGQELFTDAVGDLRVAFHAWTPGAVGYPSGGARSLRIGRVDLRRSGPALRS